MNAADRVAEIERLVGIAAHRASRNPGDGWAEDFRTEVPFLLDQLRRAEADRDRLAAQLQAVRDLIDGWSVRSQRSIRVALGDWTES